MTIAQMAVDMSALGQASTYIGAAGIALAAGGLQDSLKDLKNGLIDGVKNIFSSGSGLGSAKWNPQKYGGGIAGELYNSLMGLKESGIAPAVQAGLQNALDSTGGNSLLSSLKAIAGDIGSAVLAVAGTCSSSGSSGGFAALSELLYIQWYFQKIVDQDPTHYGYPLCKTVQINTLSGFVLCQNADDLIVSCTPAERQALLAFMEAGFYYE